MRTKLLLLICLSLWSSGCASSSCCGSTGGWWSSLWGHPGSRCGPNWYHPGFDNMTTRRHARALARASLSRYSSQAGTPSCHFRKGFECAYVDIATGSSGVTPAIPPRHYWGWAFRSPAGYTSSEEWFSGYRTGAAIAEQEGLKQFRNIPMSTMPVPNTPDDIGVIGGANWPAPVGPYPAYGYDPRIGSAEVTQGGR